MYQKYLKYKNKYINLKNKYGGSVYNSESISCPTKEDIISRLDEIKRSHPTACIDYTFITDAPYHFNFKSIFNDFENVSTELITAYESFLMTTFPFLEGTEMYTHFREILIDYKSLSNNASSSMWHFENERGDYSQLYNIIYYHKIDNCRLSTCGTDIAYRDRETNEIIVVNLPIIEDLIIVMNDNCFIHKSPVIELIDPENQGMRQLIRTHARIYEDSSEKYHKLGNILEESLYIKLDECLNKLLNEDTAIPIKHDCKLFLNYIKKYYIHEDPHILNKYKDDKKYATLLQQELF